MQKQIDVSELEQHAGEVVEDVVRSGEPWVVVRDRQPAAVLMPYIEFLLWRRPSDEEVHERFDRLMEKMAHLNAHVSEEEVARDVAEAIAEVRRER